MPAVPSVRLNVYQGVPGVGVPDGGTTGQVLMKASNADFDTEWAGEAGPVVSVFGRTGVVIATLGDYTIGLIGGLGTGVATALGVNIGSAGATVLFNGAGGTPSSLTLTNATGLPVASGISGLGTGVATALAVNVGSAGAFVTLNGALGTPSSATLTNATGLPILTGVSGLGSNVAAMLATFSSANIRAACTDESGTGSLLFQNGNLGTPSAGDLSNCTSYPISGVNTDDTLEGDGSVSTPLGIALTIWDGGEEAGI